MEAGLRIEGPLVRNYWLTILSINPKLGENKPIMIYENKDTTTICVLEVEL